MQIKQLQQQLQQMDGKGYKSYKAVQGKSYDSEWYKLCMDYVQGDPFASPSRIRVVVPLAKLQLQPEWYAEEHRKTALQDYLIRSLASRIPYSRKGTGKSGLIYIDAPGQEVMPRTALVIKDQTVDIRLSIGLPASGRRIRGKQAVQLLCSDVPELLKQGLFHLPAAEVQRFCDTADNQLAIRRYLKQHRLTAFAANGSVLPRQSGISEKPLHGTEVVPFQSPASMEVHIPLPHGGSIQGMGIREGITLIVGGGFHGKSTLLQALQNGVYNHIPDDGREYVITDDAAVKIRAEDGRRIEKVDISPFMNRLPFARSTSRFSTENASGSTSQAANVMEALESGSSLLLMDEDTCATNFMIRDARMQALVSKEKEPITPFIDNIRRIYEQRGVSTILVMGGSGDYFEQADIVLWMNEYVPQDVTQQAHEIASRKPSGRCNESSGEFSHELSRIPSPGSLNSRSGRSAKAGSKGRSHIRYGSEDIRLHAIEQLVDESQTRAIACALQCLEPERLDRKWPLSKLLDTLEARLLEHGLDDISPFKGQHPGDMALPRRFEIAAAINRIRSLRVQ